MADTTPAINVGVADSTKKVDVPTISIGAVRVEYMISPEFETCATVGFQFFDMPFTGSFCRIQDNHIFGVYKEKLYALKISKKTGFWTSLRVGGGYIFGEDRNGVGAVSGGSGGVFYRKLSLVVNYFTCSYTVNEVHHMKQQMYLGLGYDFWF